MVRRSAALVLACWALAAPGPAVSRLPEAVERAVVLVREGLPDKLAGMDRLDAGQPGPGTLARKVSDARAHGAVGVVVIGGYLAGYRSIWPEHTSIRQASYRLVSEIRESPLPV